MRLLKYLLGLALAVAIHLVGVRISPLVPLVLDPILILVLYHSLVSRRGPDIVGAAVAGLVHDALTGGVYGQLGFVDTVTAYVCSRSRRHLVILQPWRLGLFFALMALLQQTVLAAIRLLLLGGVEQLPPWSVAAKMATTGIFGALAFVAAGRVEGRSRRRPPRLKKPTIDTRRTG